MRRTKQVGIWSEMGSFWQPHPTKNQPEPPEIDSRIGAAATRAPAASKESFRPQAILDKTYEVITNYSWRGLLWAKIKDLKTTAIFFNNLNNQQLVINEIFQMI